jgi:hypothetical protein
MLAAPDFKGVGFDAKKCGGLMGVEFGLAGHVYAPLLILPWKDVFPRRSKKAYPACRKEKFSALIGAQQNPLILVLEQEGCRDFLDR